jgi:hypothetical protein
MRIRARLLAALAVAALGLSGCGSENLDACLEYEQYFYSLPCAAGLDDGIDCPAIAGYPCPATQYFTCMQQSQVCDGENLSSDVSACELKCD